MAESKSRIVIDNGIVIPEPGQEVVLDGGTVVIEGDRIAWVGDSGSTPAPVVAATRIDASGCAVLPGLIDCHAHFRPVRGLGDGLGVQAWHDRYVHQFAAEMSPDDAYYGALMTSMEMLRNGITTVLGMASISLVEPREIDGAHDAGIRARLVPHVHARTEIEQTIQQIEREAAAGADRVRTCLGFEVPQTLDADTLRLVGEARERLGVLVHTHFSEFEHEDLAPLAEAGLLEHGVSLAHCVHLTHDEIELLANRGVAVSHNPKSNSRYGNGVAPLRALLDRGVIVGLGTDGPICTYSCDVFEEARVAAFLARATSADPTALSAHEALALATSGGAQLVGMGDELGALRAGAKADVIVVDLRSLSFVPVLAGGPHANVLPLLAFSATGQDVRDVIVDGQLVLRDSGFQRLDQEEVRAQCQRRAERILAEM